MFCYTVQAYTYLLFTYILFPYIPASHTQLH
jgi:hypothetical protein